MEQKDRSEEDLSLEALDARIQAMKPQEVHDKQAEMNGWAQAMRLAVDLLAGVIVGVLIGLALDKATGLSPLFIIVCTMLGAAGGMRNMLRTSQRLDNRLDSGR